MKKQRQKFNYQKYDEEGLIDQYQYWGLHPKNGVLRIDTKRLKKLESKGILLLPDDMKHLPNGIFKSRNTVYLIPSKVKREDYIINQFRDEIKKLKDDWYFEYKVVLDEIKTPREVAENSRISNLMYTSCSDDYEDINVEAFLEGTRRVKKYEEIVLSVHTLFIQMVCEEIDRLTSRILKEVGYKEKKFNFRTFRTFTDGLSKNKNQVKIEDLDCYHYYNSLHKVYIFLKHNSKDAYDDLAKRYPDYIINSNDENGGYYTGLRASSWINFDNFKIEKFFDKIELFFEDYCKTYLSEDIEESKWNYSDFFKEEIFKRNLYFYKYNMEI